MSDETQANWIAVDWGTSNLRTWLMTGKMPVAEASTDDGMSSLRQFEFEQVLTSLIEPWLSDTAMPIIACGMVGSLQGWLEAPYLATPTMPLSGELVRPDARDPRISVYVIPGIKQSDPPDVMRGEETQIAGFLKADPEFDGVICLPGTHTKWVQISAGEIVSFRTFMTGEMFDLMSTQSVLRHSVGPGWDAGTFADAIADTIAKPETLASLMFRLRADDLLNGTPSDKTRSRLSGLLIGAELAAARAYWLGQQIILIGNENLVQLYSAALDLQGAPSKSINANDATLTGLGVARDLIMETSL
ncbi:MAG: 2-dehydro-3-deoxygalactonokinase [Boseongicola sp.]